MNGKKWGKVLFGTLRKLSFRDEFFFVCREDEKEEINLKEMI